MSNPQLLDAEERVAQIKARLAKATPGQWFLCDGDQSDPLIVADAKGDGDLRHGVTVFGFSLSDGDDEAHYIITEGDARLIANAPADLSWALSRIAETREGREAAGRADRLARAP